jgi:PadR family transcriptional regulator, regulatory protein PadR
MINSLYFYKKLHIYNRLSLWTMRDFSRLEEIFLLTIYRLKENAYGVNIKNEIFEQIGKKISFGALYFTLDQITKKEYVSKKPGEPTPVKGGCRKIYYKLTDKGVEALKQAHSINNVIWSGISESELDQTLNEPT